MWTICTHSCQRYRLWEKQSSISVKKWEKWGRAMCLTHCNQNIKSKNGGGGSGGEDPAPTFLQIPNTIDKNSSICETYWVLHGDRLFLELVILFIYFLLVSNKTTPSLFAYPNINNYNSYICKWILRFAHCLEGCDKNG